MGLKVLRFQLYDPFLTYSHSAGNADKKIFIDPKGENPFNRLCGQATNHNPEPALWEVGKAAYDVLVKRHVGDPTAYEILTSISLLDEDHSLARMLDDMVARSKLIIENRRADWKGFLVDDIDPGTFISALYAIQRASSRSDQMLDFESAFAICCLIGVDNALVAHFLDADFGNFVLDAHEFLKKAIAQDEAKLARAELAEKAARARHKETYALRAEVIGYWIAHISPNLSAEKAATLLSKHFPLSHRKLSEYVAAEKKLRRAGRA